jgi:hypothetical protein
MCRGSATGINDLGLGYAGVTMGVVAAIADHVARAGDTSLFTYNTAQGVCSGTPGSSVGTINDGGSRVGQNKDLLFGMQLLMNYWGDVYTRYLGTVGNIDDRLDGRDPRNGSGWSGVQDTFAAQGNGWYQDLFVKGVYTRQAANTAPYPVTPPSSPGTEPWTGSVGVLPGLLFMFGGLEGIVGHNQLIDPYVAGSPQPLAPPTNLRVVP